MPLLLNCASYGIGWQRGSTVHGYLGHLTEGWSIVHFATGFPVLVMSSSPTRPYPSGIILPCLHSRSMPTNADAQRCYRHRRALATGPDADVRRRRDTALHCERQKRHRAQLVSSTRTYPLDALATANAAPDVRRSTAAQPHREHQTYYQTHHANFLLPSCLQNTHSRL